MSGGTKLGAVNAKSGAICSSGGGGDEERLIAIETSDTFHHGKTNVSTGLVDRLVELVTSKRVAEEQLEKVEVVDGRSRRGGGTHSLLALRRRIPKVLFYCSVWSQFLALALGENCDGGRGGQPAKEQVKQALPDVWMREPLVLKGQGEVEVGAYSSSFSSS